MLVICLTGLIVAYVVYENVPLLSAIRRKLLTSFEEDYCDRVFGRIASRSRTELAQGGVFLAARPARGASMLEELVRNHRRAPTTNNFATALLARAVYLEYTIDGDQRAIDAVESYLAKEITSDGLISRGLHMLDQCVIGYTLFDVYQATGKEQYLRAVKAIRDYLIVKHTRSPSGLLPYRIITPNLLYTDTLGMICPFLSRCGAVLQCEESRELAFKQLVAFHANAVCRTTSLPFHAYDEQRGVALGLRGWTRGAGWYLTGLADSIPWFVKESSERRALETYLADVVKAVSGFQREDGLWAWEMGQVDGHQDTSGTAMIAYSAARAMALGIVSSHYGQVVMGAVRRIPRNTTKSGKVCNCLCDCQGIGNYPQLYGHFSVGQAMTQLLMFESRGILSGTASA